MINRIVYCSLAVVAMAIAPTSQGANDARSVPFNPEREAYYGDLHLITGNAFTGYVAACRLTPTDAYRFARGEPVTIEGKSITRRSAPLDFLAVTDFGEYLGLFNTLYDPNSPFSNTEIGRELRDPATRSVAFARFLDLALYHRGKEIPWFGLDPQLVNATMALTWQEEVKAANAMYQPGKFSTFIGYHWTAKVGGTQDRVVLFRGDMAPLPFTSFDSLKPEDLWTYIENNRKRGIDSLAIPHNSNISNGLMFDGLDSDGKVIDQAYARRRAANEPVVEISNNGQSETLPRLSPGDGFADFEMFGNENLANPQGSYVRDGLGRGLEIAQRIGIDPYKLGFVGGTDFHNAMSDAAENATDSVPDAADPSIGLTEGVLRQQSRFPHPYASGSLTGVWAEQNTRESIFAAIRRKETFATSGTRLKFRFFGGWNFHFHDRLVADKGWVRAAYRDGVPMGSNLPPRPADRTAPTFLAWATKDPSGANLDRLQIVKIWLKNGVYAERVFDVALSGGRKASQKEGEIPPVGNTVDLKTARYTDTIGTPEMEVWWTDPEFDAGSPAAYYLRVLEIPTPRWSTIASVKAGIPLIEGIAATIQERGWSSPVWYSPPTQTGKERRESLLR